MIRQRHPWIASLLVTIALAAIVTAARAEPYRPKDPDLVLLRLAPADRSTAASGAREAPASLAAALKLAAERIEDGRRTAQPRGFGRAESVLESWRTRAARSAQWHVLAADIHQYRHEYPRALALLDRALLLEPGNVRAHLMRAAIRQTQGEFQAARSDCTALLGRAEHLLGTTCLAQILGLTGQLDRAHALLERQLNAAGEGATIVVRVWMLSALADMADRRGDAAGAERHLREALLLDPHHPYIRLTLADLLLAQGHAAQVDDVLQDLPATPAALLRRAEARRAAGSRVDDLLARLHQAMAEARQRGEQVDWRDVARLHRLEGRRCEALRAAQANWLVQREPLDMRLLAVTAQECGNAGALEEIRRWRTLTGYEDARADRAMHRAELPT